MRHLSPFEKINNPSEITILWYYWILTKLLHYILIIINILFNISPQNTFANVATSKFEKIEEKSKDSSLAWGFRKLLSLLILLFGILF